MRTRMKQGTMRPLAMWAALLVAGCSGDAMKDGADPMESLAPGATQAPQGRGAEEAPETPGELMVEHVQAIVGAAPGAVESETFRVEDVDDGAFVSLFGAPARELYEAMVKSHAFAVKSTPRLDYALGYYTVCAATDTDAVCQFFVSPATAVHVPQPDEGSTFDLVYSGRRFDSAATETYVALVLSQGLVPQTTYSVAGQNLACGKDATTVVCGVFSPPQVVELDLTLNGLPDLGADFVYEGWLITPNGPVSTGRFSVGGDDFNQTFEVDADAAEAASLFVLTIEPAVGDDPAPAATHVLAGALGPNGLAALRVEHPAALGTNFLSASGGYILETPTSMYIQNDYDQGVWFLDPTKGPGPGLDLPELPDGWVYEGWVVGPDGPISTGRFTTAMGADSDGAGPTAGMGDFPPFPGQDFIDPPLVLTEGYAVVISVEPEPDFSPAPFAIKPLVDMTVDDVGPGTFQTMANNALATLPSGLVILEP